MALYTKSIFAQREPTDGKRISVMSKHTCSDGKTLDVRIVEGESYDEWRKILAPPEKLVGAHYRGLPWNQFRAAYKEYLKNEAVDVAVKKLAIEADQQDITILCAEPLYEHCHRRILAAACRLYLRNLKVQHR